MKKNVEKNLDMYEILEAQSDAKSKAILPIALFRDEKAKVSKSSLKKDALQKLIDEE